MAKDLREEVRRLRAEGWSEEDAVRKAAGKGKARTQPEADIPPVDEDDLDEAEPDTDGSARQFVIVTKDFSGLGWAKKLLEEGEDVVIATDYSAEEDPKLRKAMKKVGDGWFEVVSTKDAAARYSGAYFVFSENAFPELAAKLIDAGEKVFPRSMPLGEKMEHDRNYACEIAEEAGLEPPVTHEFTSLEDGISFIEANPETAYVFKPDDGKFNYMTFVPVRKKDADANQELLSYLNHMKQDPGPFILQERIAQEDGLEVNVECWFYEGKPFLAVMGLEVKRKITYDIGEMTGCGGDVVQFIPLDSPLVQQTVGRMFSFYEEQGYTGFADVNVIFTKDGTPHFLEVCNRFGYNAHVTMFLALAKDGFGNIIADFVDGHVEDMADRFHTDIGGSLTLFIDHPREGLPVHVDPAAEERFYPFDGMMEDGQLLLTEFSQEIGIVVDRAATPEKVAEKILNAVIFDEVVSVPDIYYRMDLGETDYYNAPVTRYKELKKRGLLL